MVADVDASTVLVHRWLGGDVFCSLFVGIQVIYIVCIAVEFEDRFDEFATLDDPPTVTLYGSLFSNAGVVMSYLVRMEPFTTLHYNF